MKGYFKEYLLCLKFLDYIGYIFLNTKYLIKLITVKNTDKA